MASIQIEEIESILWDGTEEQLNELEGKPLAFSYSQKYRAFTIYGQNERSYSHGAPYTPNCVKLFGNEHVFGSGSCIDNW